MGAYFVGMFILIAIVIIGAFYKYVLHKPF